MSAQSPLSRDIMQESGKNTGYKGDLKPMKPVRKKEEKVSLPSKKVPSVAGASKAAPKKESTAPRSGSAVSRTQREDSFIKGLKEEATSRQAASDTRKKAQAKRTAEAEKFVGKKPAAKLTPDFKDRDEQRRAMKEYGEERKKVKGIADKYKGILSRAAKMFADGGSFKEVPAGAKGLSKLPKPVRNKMGYAKNGGKMPKYGYGGKMKK
jgi:hypothetical protein